MDGIPSKVAAGGPGEAAECGAGWARLQLLDQVTDPQPRVPAQGNKASNLCLQTPAGVETAAGETPSLTGEFVGETHRVLGRAQTTTRESAPEGPTLLVGSRESD